MSRRPGRRLPHLLAAAALAVTASMTAAAHSTAAAAPGSPALTPPLGWNSWNSFGCGITEAQVRQAADAMVSSGMRDAGYQYVVVDDCWFDPQRDAAGNLRANPTKFPSGMKALGDYIHGKGLKFGIYQVPGERTCAQGSGAYPGSTGSKGHEAQDAAAFAAWGVDYLKYDWCSSSGTRDEQVARFTLMRDALRATGRPIVYSINPNSFHAITGDKYNWGEVADLWRTTEDLLDIWQNGNTNSYLMGVGNVLDVTAPLAAQSGPGHWNDPDMLVVGRPGLSLTESRLHFALWALMSAPLMAGNDIRTMSADVSTILRNPRLLAVNQDPWARAGAECATTAAPRCSPSRCPTARSRWACSTGAPARRRSPRRPRKSACPVGRSPSPTCGPAARRARPGRYQRASPRTASPSSGSPAAARSPPPPRV